MDSYTYTYIYIHSYIYIYTRHPPARHRQNLLEVVQGHRIAASLWDDGMMGLVTGGRWNYLKLLGFKGT